MKRIPFRAPVTVLAFFVLASTLAKSAHAAPVVSNLTASQRAGSQLVDIGYDLASHVGSLAVSLEISSDAGATWTVPAATLSGDVGASVAPGTGKVMVWDAGIDWAGNYSEQMRFRVVADDGFALIPGGSFTMGATSGDTDSDAPPITVGVSTFYLSKYETTKALWDEVRAWGLDNGYSDLPVGGGKGADYPVGNVSWWHAVKWCNARSEMEGLTPVYTVGGEPLRTGTTVPEVDWSANGYRLPTEAEWEKAARGGVSGARFPWGGDEINHDHANYYANGSAYSYDTSPYTTSTYHPDYSGISANWTGPYTSPVGSFAANGYGLRDMAGNVAEWCWDWYGGSYYTTSDGTTNPPGPESGSNRVNRGGNWNGLAHRARASDRSHTPPSSASNNVGFRAARSRLIDEFAVIPGGSFTMGATSGDTDTNAPPITVTVSTFHMAETETTKALWDEVRTWGAANGYSDLPVGGGKGADHPVHTVSWWDVVKWCNARSEMEDLTPVYTVGGDPMRTGTTVPEVDWSANGYRLPTEAEWEKAARGGVSGKRFPWGGDEINHDHANYRANGSAYTYDTSPYTTFTYHPDYNDGTFPYTSPVGSFAGNGFGLKDMAGNVWEWCWDWYGDSYYTTSNGTTDPRGPGSGTARVHRGGSWGLSALNARCAHRGNNSPGLTGNSLGFRPARSAVPSSAETDDLTADTRSDDADLSGLVLSSGILAPDFASGTTAYAASVANATSAITVTPTPSEPNASIEVRVNGGDFAAVAPGSPSGALALDAGSNTVDVLVTAQDGTTQRTYTIAVTRRAAPAVTSPASASITATGATLGGNVTGDGEAAITERGVVYSATATNGDPLVDGAGVTKVTASGTTGVFTAPVTGLTQGTVYSFKAYATNSEGTSYTEAAVFTTDAIVSFVGGAATFERDILPGVRHRFHFALDGPRFVALSTAGGAALRAELRDASGEVVASFEGDGDFELERLLMPGDYVLEVYRQPGEGPSQSYTLDIDASTAAASRPDVAVGASAARMTGRNVFGGRQQAKLVSRKARPVTGHVRVGNRGKLPDVLGVRGTSGNRFFKIAYFARGNVTAAMRTGTHRTPTLADGAEAAIRVAVKPDRRKLTRMQVGRTTILRRSLIVSISANSTFDPARRDAATLNVRTKRSVPQHAPAPQKKPPRSPIGIQDARPANVGSIGSDPVR